MHTLNGIKTIKCSNALIPLRQIQYIQPNITPVVGPYHCPLIRRARHINSAEINYTRVEWA